MEKFIIGKICSLYLFFVACMNAYNGKDKVKKGMQEIVLLYSSIRFKCVYISW